MTDLDLTATHRSHASPSLVKRPALVVAFVAVVIAAAHIRWPRLIDSLGGEVRRLNGVWLVPAIALAGVSMLTAALQQRRVLRARGVSLPVRSMMAITFAANAVSVTLPLAGSTAGTAYTYAQLKRRGADVPTAAWALATSGIISTTVLAAVLGVGAAVTGDGATSIVGPVAMVLGIVPIAVLLMSFRSELVRHRVERMVQVVVSGVRRVIRRAGDLDAAVVSRAFQRLAGFRLGWRAGAASSVYAAVNWVTDIACLAVCVTALGVPVPWTHLAVIYGATLGAASLSFTPAGIGLVESAIAVALVQSGVPTASAIVAAVLYRAVSCWLVLCVGWVSYATMRRVNLLSGTGGRVSAS
ncbi:MAG TPA: lysylphosphatidylglycerol synthase transmembrane domain-containing protein [Ilumatobacteraceae bacterium]